MLFRSCIADIRESHPEVVDTAPNNHGRPSPCVNVGKAKNRRGKTQWSSTEWYLPRHLEILKGQIYGRAISNDFMINFARLTPCAVVTDVERDPYVTSLPETELDKVRQHSSVRGRYCENSYLITFGTKRGGVECHVRGRLTSR